MSQEKSAQNRRAFLASGLKAATITAAACAFPRADFAKHRAKAAISLFDGKTLDGWIDVENSSVSFSRNDIADLAGLAKKLTDKQDPVSAFLSAQLTDAVNAELAAFSPASDAKAVGSALAQNLTTIIAGAPIYDAARFQGVTLRPETQSLLGQNPQGVDLIHLNRMLIEDAFPAELAKGVSTGWIVKDGVMASTGTGRGTIYTANDYGHFRLIFTMRHVSGNPDHKPCILIFCTRPVAGQPPLDALGGIQFQSPNGGHWDYRPGKNNDGGAEFTTVTKSTFDAHEWSRVEILADASKGTARMAVAQPLGSKAVELLDFQDLTAGKAGPIAWQIHNAGLFDEYKDITIEVNPKVDDLITVK